MKGIDEKIEMLKRELEELEAEKEKYPTTIGGRIKKLMKINGVTACEISKKTGCTHQTITRYVNDQRKIPVEVLGTIAKTFGVPCDYLIFGDESNAKMDLEDLK